MILTYTGAAFDGIGFWGAAFFGTSAEPATGASEKQKMVAAKRNRVMLHLIAKKTELLSRVGHAANPTIAIWMNSVFPEKAKILTRGHPKKIPLHWAEFRQNLLQSAIFVSPCPTTATAFESSGAIKKNQIDPDYCKPSFNKLRQLLGVIDVALMTNDNADEFKIFHKAHIAGPNCLPAETMRMITVIRTRPPGCGKLHGRIKMKKSQIFNVPFTDH